MRGSGERGREKLFERVAFIKQGVDNMYEIDQVRQIVSILAQSIKADLKLDDAGDPEIATRIANRLNLGGTNCITDAACASSLAASLIRPAVLQSSFAR